MKKLAGSILAVAAIVRCGGDLTDPFPMQSVADPLAPPAGPPYTSPPGGRDGPLVTGDAVEIARATIPPEGGVLTVDRPDHPLHGLTLEVREGSFASATEVRISAIPYVSGRLHDAFDPIGPAVEIDHGPAQSARVMFLRFPRVPDDADLTADRFGGGLEHPVHLALHAAGHGWAVFGGTFFGKVLLSVPSGARLLHAYDGWADSTFAPGRDDWPFENHGSRIAPAGHCEGQSASAAWYFSYRGGGLNPARGDGPYDGNGSGREAIWPGEPTRNLFQDDVTAYKLASVVQAHDLWPLSVLIANVGDMIFTWASLLAATSAERTVTDAINGIRKGHPLMLILEGTGPAHAVVAFAAGRGAIFYADPNAPGATAKMSLAEGGRFETVELRANAHSAPATFDRSFVLAVEDLVKDRGGAITPRFDRFADNDSLVDNPDCSVEPKNEDRKPCGEEPTGFVYQVTCRNGWRGAWCPGRCGRLQADTPGGFSDKFFETRERFELRVDRNSKGGRWFLHTENGHTTFGGLFWSKEVDYQVLRCIPPVG